MFRAFAIFCIGFCLATSSAQAARKPKVDPQPKVIAAAPADVNGRFAAAERSYNDYHYEEAIVMLVDVLGDSAFSDGGQRQKARVLLAFSYYITQHEKEAAIELERLFRENSDYLLDRDSTHPDMLRFYDAERARYLAAFKPAVEPPATKPLVQPSVNVETIGDRNKWVRIFPAGIGHFLNHDYAGGGVFLGLEAALLATNISMVVLRAGLRDPKNTANFREGTQSQQFTYQTVMNVAALSALTLVVIEVIDAFVWSPARGRESMAKSLQADLGPLGVYQVAFGVF